MHLSYDLLTILKPKCQYTKTMFLKAYDFGLTLFDILEECSFQFLFIYLFWLGWPGIFYFLPVSNIIILPLFNFGVGTYSNSPIHSFEE